MRNEKWGYVRETRDMAAKAAHHSSESVFTGLEDYLDVIFPGKIWVHDQRFGKRNGTYYGIRPDYLCEEDKIIVEFDGVQHYTNPNQIVKDRNNTKIYENLGYRVIRIPYFVQLTNEVVKELFGVDVPEPLADSSMVSMSTRWENTPAYCCYSGLLRMASEFKRFPQQYEINLQQLEKEDAELSGFNLLKSAFESSQSLNNIID